MNFLFCRIFWVIEIVKLCLAADHIAFSSSCCLSYAADGTMLDIFPHFYSIAAYILREFAVIYCI